MKIRLFLLLFFSLSISALFFGHINKAKAANLGGSDYSNAVALIEGGYTVGPVQTDKSYYYSMSVPAGEELKVDYKFKNYFIGDVTLYDVNEKKLAGSEDQKATIRWLNSAKDNTPNKIYIVITNASDPDNCELNVAFVLRQDTVDGFDAGNGYDDATSIKYGESTGYLSSFIYGNVGGNDTDDYYKLDVKKGETVTVRITPEGKNFIGFAVYNSQREELYLDEGQERVAGQIAQKAFKIDHDGIIYVVARWPFFNPNEDYIVKYTVLLSNTEVSSDTVNVDTGESTTTDNDGATDLNISSQSLKDKLSIKNILIALFVIAIFVVMMVILFVVIMRGKKKGPTGGSAGSSSDDKPKNEEKADENKEEKPEEPAPEPVEEKVPEIKEKTPEKTPIIDSAPKPSDSGKQKVEVTVEEGTEVNVKTVPENDK